MIFSLHFFTSYRGYVTLDYLWPQQIDGNIIMLARYQAQTAYNTRNKNEQSGTAFRRQKRWKNE